MYMVKRNMPCSCVTAGHTLLACTNLNLWALDCLLLHVGVHFVGCFEEPECGTVDERALTFLGSSDDSMTPR